MENREQQILSEIKSMMASIRGQLEKLDAKMAELQQVVDPEEFDMAPIDIDIEETVQEEPVQVVEAQEIPLEVEEPAEEPETVEPEPEVVDDDLPFGEIPAKEEGDDDDLPGVFDLPQEPVTVAAKAADEAKPILNEVMAADCAWRKDMPGSPVRDIRSAISLNDRVIFINLLFKEDAQTFVDTLAKINTMETLDQAVEYICTTFPSWDLNSDLVYRFMMAVRRKVK